MEFDLTEEAASPAKAEVNDGGPAFPQPATNDGHACNTPYQIAGGGMSLRDYFAAAALAAIVRERDALRSLNGEPDYPMERNLADACYGIADAMLKAREND